jgi:hypothetical protein
MPAVYAWRVKDSGQSEGTENSTSGRRVVSPTYLDTLNIGREVGLENDMNATPSVSPSLQKTSGQDGTSKTIGSGTISGGVFRIQCMAAGSMEKIKAFKKEFETKMDLPASVIFAEPYYKLLVGNFNTRQEAEQVLQKVKDAGYRESWIVRLSEQDAKMEDNTDGR